MPEKPEKKKILYIITQGTWGGAQRYVFDLATNLSQNFTILVAVGELQGKKDLQEKLRKKGVEVIQLRHLQRTICPWSDLMAIFELAKLYQQTNPDVVHLNSSKAGIIGSLAKLICRKKIIYTVHGWVFNEPLAPLTRSLYRWLEKITAKMKNTIVVLSPEDYEAGKKAGIPENKMKIISLGIDIPNKIMSRGEARQKISQLLPTPSPSDNFWAVTIANFFPTKGLDILVEAVQKIKNTKLYLNTHFFIIGEGPERNKIENLIQKYNLRNNLHLLGNINNAAELLPAFDLFILPSRKEGLPYTLLEAMLYGIPFIASNVGGISSMTENKKSGLLVEPAKPDLLAEKIQYSLEHLEELKGDAKNTFPKYDLPTMIEKTISSY